MNQSVLQDAIKTLEKGKSLANFQYDSDFWNHEDIVTDEMYKTLNRGDFNEPIVEDDEYNLEAPKLLPGYFFESINTNNELTELCNFLNKNYSKKNKVRPHFTEDFLKWLLHTEHKIADEWPDVKYCGDWKFYLKNKEGIVGMIAAIPQAIQVNMDLMIMADIKLVCVSEKFRNQKCMPLLVKELKRRVAKSDVYQGLFTTTANVAHPVCEIDLYSRVLDVKKMVDCNFFDVGEHSSLEDQINKHKLPARLIKDQLKKLSEKHVAQVCEGLNNNTNKYNLCPIFTENHIRTHFLNNPIVVAYVKEDDYGNVTDFISFYNLNLLMAGTDTRIKTGNLYYYYSPKMALNKLLGEVLCLAKENDYMLFSALDVLENSDIFYLLNFDIIYKQHKTEGKIKISYNYYFYNWLCRDLKNNQLGYVGIHI